MDRSPGVDSMKRFAPFAIVLLLTSPTSAYPPPAAQDPVAKLKQFDGLWTDLAGEEAPATRALLKLSARPDDAVALFAARLKPLKIDEKTVRDLLKDLNSEKDDVWKKAYDTLDYFDPRLAIDLPTLMNDVTDYPARARLYFLLAGYYTKEKFPELDGNITLREHTDQKGEVYYNFVIKNGSTWAEHKVERINAGNFGCRRAPWTRAVRAISLLEHIGTPAAEAVLKDLATGHSDAQPTKAAKEALKRMGKEK
jgi:hypothetical protein